MTLVQIEHLVLSGGMVVKEEGGHDDKDIDDGGGGMVDTENVKEGRGLRLFCTAKPSEVRLKQTMQTKPRKSFLFLDGPVQNLWKPRRQVVPVMGVWSQQIVREHHWHLTLGGRRLLSMSPALKRSDRRCRAGNAPPISKKEKSLLLCESE